MDFYIGVCVGTGLALLMMIVIGLMLEEYLPTTHPFRHATVADFQTKPEGG